MKKTAVFSIFGWMLFVLLTSFSPSSLLQTEEGDALVGIWMPSHGKAKVKITKVGTKYYGKIVWLKEPNYPDGTKKRDKNNPDAKMHDTPLLGYKILKDFEYKGKKTWVVMACTGAGQVRKRVCLFRPVHYSRFSCRRNAIRVH